MAARRKGARGPGRPPAGTPQLTCEDVARTAGEVFRYQGYSGTKLKTIADRLGVSTAALYHYFPSKQDLFFAWLEGLRQSSMEGLDDAPSDLSPSDRVRHLVRRLTMLRLEATGSSGRPKARLSNRQLAAQLPPAQARRFAALERGQMHVVRDLIEAGIASGDFDVTNTTALAFTILGLPERAAEWFRPGGEMSADDVADLMGDVAVKMLVKRKRP